MSDIYEAYLFSLVLRAARIEDATVTLACIEGGTPNPFVIRTSPGYLNSHQRNYGFAVIHFPGCTALEAHLGVRVSGHSAVLHECDISVLLQAEADVCRNSTKLVAPRSHKVIVAVSGQGEIGLWWKSRLKTITTFLRSRSRRLFTPRLCALTSPSTRSRIVSGLVGLHAPEATARRFEKRLEG